MFNFNLVVAQPNDGELLFACGCWTPTSHAGTYLCHDHWRHLQALLRDNLDYPPATDIIAGIRSFDV